MAQLTVTIITHDEEFKRQVAQLLRACGVPVGIVEARAGAETSAPDIVVVDIRADASSGMAAIERLRARQPAMAIFAIAAAAEPDLILQAMRAGANEFFAWTPGGRRRRRARWRSRSTARCAAPRRAARRQPPARDRPA